MGGRHMSTTLEYDGSVVMGSIVYRDPRQVIVPYGPISLSEHDMWVPHDVMFEISTQIEIWRTLPRDENPFPAEFDSRNLPEIAGQASLLFAEETIGFDWSEVDWFECIMNFENELYMALRADPGFIPRALDYGNGSENIRTLMAGARNAHNYTLLEDLKKE
jgi:hypothetical protein